MDNSKKNTRKSNNSCKNTSQNDGIGLENLSYADFVLLSSILAYTIAEELNNTDLDLFIVFLGIVQSELATLRLQRGLKDSNAVIEESETSGKIAEEAIIPATRYSRIKKVKRKKKKKIKRKDRDANNNIVENDKKFKKKYKKEDKT